METLAEYVDRVMKEKNLKALDVEARSIEAGNRIADSYVTNIVRGVNKNLSIEKLTALADGLDVDKIELFKIAAGIEDTEETWNAQSLMQVIQKLFRLKSKEIKAVKKLLNIK